jgi:hypothetical protein
VRRALSLLVPVVVLGAGVALFVVGGQRDDDAAADLAAARVAEDRHEADAATAEAVDRHLAAARRAARDLEEQWADLAATSAPVLALSREDLGVMDRLVAALRARDRNAYNDAIVAAQDVTDRRSEAQDLFGGDGAQLNGIAGQVAEALDAAEDRLAEG